MWFKKLLKRRLFIFSVIVIISLGILVNNNNEIYQVNDKTEKPQKSIKLIDYNDEPLIISGNANLEILNISGNGESWDNPYIIEDLKIDANSSEFAIKLSNITKYVVTRNCDIYLNSDGKDMYSYAKGIYIRDSFHIMIENCSVYDNYRKSNSFGLYAIRSQDIYIKNNFFEFLSNGIGMYYLNNCTVEGNDIRNNSIGIIVRHSENIQFFSNKIEGITNSSSMKCDGIYIDYSMSIKIQNNNFSYLADITLIYISNITVVDNKFEPGLSIDGEYVISCLINNNTFEQGGISFHSSNDIIIIENTICRGGIAITLYSVNSCLIESNSILYPGSYAFRILNSTDIIIRLNIIQGISLSIFSPDSQMKSMQFNYLIPKFSYIIFGIALLSIFILSSIVYFNFKKQYEKLMAFQNTPSEKNNNNLMIDNNKKYNFINGDNQFLFKNFTKYLLDYEKSSFRKFFGILYFILGILIPLSIRKLISPLSIISFLNINYEIALFNDYLKLVNISNLVLIIFWLLGFLLIYWRAKKVIPHRSFQNGINLNKKEKLLFVIFIGVFIILWILFYYLSIFYGYILYLIPIGIFCCICFIPILYLPFKNKYVELPIIGIILLIFSISTFLNSTENVNVVYGYIKWVCWLLFIGSSILVWIGALNYNQSYKRLKEINSIQK